MNVEVNTDTLKAGGTAVENYCLDCEFPYNSVVSISSGNCTSLESFKSALKGKFDTFSNHSDITNTTLNVCASDLENTDNLIGNNVTNILPSPDGVSNIEQDGMLDINLNIDIDSDEYMNDYDPANLPSQTLYDSNGVLIFSQNGKSVYETFCPDSLKTSYDLKLYILSMGYDPGYWVRDDGVQMCGKDVMYAADIPSWDGTNISNSKLRRGDKWYGTSGPGRIVGGCGTSQEANLGTFTRNGKKYDVTYDTYTNWWDGGVYQERHYSADPTYATENIINNPPAPNSERYYQTNESWNDFFKKFPGFKPVGTENVTDWVSYFQQNNPEK